ncbi:MAG: DUF3617 domain-containing protein [Roseateles sp.]|uniref:DUF3617 domain-containing protein n=1 Tax=Roseateles sp. TaxID=1971397 RepID=UPI004035BFBC
MKSTALLLMAGLAAASPTMAHAQGLKPGLWEFKQTPQLGAAHQTEMAAQMAQAQKAMEGMSPDQRKMVEQMMAQRGVSVNMSGGVITVKACITQEQAARNLAPLMQQGNCSQDSKRSGNVIQTQFVCTNPASEGEAIVTLRGNEGFTNDVTIRQQRQGKTETTKVNGEGRWLGADCGDVKPLKSQAKP